MSIAVATNAIGALTVAHLAYTWIRLSMGTSQTVSAITGAADVPSPVAGDGLPRYLVLLPMLREERVAAAACAHFLPVVLGNPRVDVVVVTGLAESDDRAAAQETIRARARTGGGTGSCWRGLATRAVLPDALGVLERAIGAADLVTVEDLLAQRHRLTTAEVIDPVVDSLNNRVGRHAFHHLSVDATAVTKVAKLNVALATWFSSRTDTALTYVGVYDADSAPDPATFHLIDCESTRRHSEHRKPPEIFQQVSCYCRKLPQLTGLKGVFALADAVAQTRWALGFEYPLYLRYSSAVRRGQVRPLAYCVGHGSFASAQFLTAIGGFPAQSPTDDLALGYVASAMGAEIAAIPALDYCEVAPDPVKSMRQSRFWFSGSARFWRDLRFARTGLEAKLIGWQLIRLHLDGFGRNLAWAGRGLAWLVSTCLAALTGQWWLLAALLFANFLYVQLGYAQTLHAIRRLPHALRETGIQDVTRTRLLLAGFAATATFVLRSLGPLTCAAESFRGKRMRSWKHER